MKILLTIAMLSLIAMFAAATQASQVVQAFACTLNDGKSIDNVWALTDAYIANWSKLDQSDEGAGAFLWTPFRGASDYDYIIGFTNSSLNDMVTGLASYYDSGVGAPLDAQFAETGDCISAIMMSDQIKNGTIGNTADRELDAVVELFACTIDKGSDMDDIEAAERYWRDQVADLGSEATNKFEAYRWVPYRGGTGQADFLWVGNYPDFATWAEGETVYQGSKQGKAADARLEKVSTCTSSMWMGYWVVPPPGGPTAP